MASSSEVRDCHVCFEQFSLDTHIPRLLPCSHTVCHPCIERLIGQNRRLIKCPECRAVHRLAGQDVTTFPQNKYILHIIHLNRKTKRCDEHQNELVLYCNEPSCKVAICPKCYSSAHKGHDVTDLDSQNADNLKKLDDNVNAVIALIQSGIDELETFQTDMNQSANEALSTLREDQNKIEEHLEKLATMLNIIKNNKTTVRQTIRNNNNIINCKVEYLKQELKKAKHVKANSLKSLRENDCTNIFWMHDRIDVFENIESHLASFCSNAFNLDQVRYQQPLSLWEMPEIPPGFADSLTTKKLTCKIMEGCTDQIKTNKRKRKQVMEEVPILQKRPRNTGPPDLDSQREIIDQLAKKMIQSGDTRYLIDVKWYETWKKYIGYESSSAGNYDRGCAPGQINNSPLLQEGTQRLKLNLKETTDFIAVSEEAWIKLSGWYGCKEGSEIPRKVYTLGFIKLHHELDIYQKSYKLCQYPDLDYRIVKEFSRSDKIQHVQDEMRNLFGIPDHREVRLWNIFDENDAEVYRMGDSDMSLTNQLFKSPNARLGDVWILQGSLIVIEMKNEDGTWSAPWKP